MSIIETLVIVCVHFCGSIFKDILFFELNYCLCYFNRDIFPCDPRLYVQNDVVADLANGTMVIVGNIPTQMLEI
jgi:hypothetical protein